MKKGLTEIGIVLDKSGSMGAIRKDTVGGFNTFIEDQKKEQGEAKLSLITFNEKLENVYKYKDIQTISELTNYVPAGLTALYDGIGTMIDTLKGNIDGRDEDEKPEKVIIVIITDGFENASKEYDSKTIKNKIKELEDNENWAFIYLGANQDAFSVGGSLGFNPNGTANWDSDVTGSNKMYRVMSKTMSSYRSTGVVNLTKIMEDENKGEV